MIVEKSKAYYPNGYWTWWYFFGAEIGRTYMSQQLGNNNELLGQNLYDFEIVEMTEDGSEIWLEKKREKT